MTHLPYIFACYVLAIGVPLAFAIGAFRRTRAASRRLASIDPRRKRGREA